MRLLPLFNRAVQRPSYCAFTCSLLIGCLMLTQAWSLSAQELPQLQAQQAHPVPGGDYNGSIFVEGAAVAPLWRPTASLLFLYAYKPLVFEDRRTGDVINVLEHQVQADVMASVGLWGNTSLGIALPVSLVQSGEQAPGVALNLEGAGLGDVRLTPKWSLRGSMPVGWNIAASATIGLPTGDSSRLLGESGVSVTPNLIGQWLSISGTRINAQLGYRIRPQQRIFDLELGNQLSWGASWHQSVVSGVLNLGVEAYGRLPLDADTSWDPNATPAEVVGVASVWPAREHAIVVGAGPGLTKGFGSPTVRGFLGYRYTWRAQDDPMLDLDGDGIENALDQCPTDPEDFDQFEDEDGCPDLDNDQDSILDLDDQCPNVPEDKDQFEDEDGCPDLDNDQDDIADSEDQCPNVPEDRDDFEDADGCPDLDNDQDGLTDSVDQCPLEPEDFDQFQDEDGCPDPDNDRDGVLDVNDECPQEQEVYNGVKDEDGCPDTSQDRVEWTRARILLKEELYFNFNRAKLQDRSRPILLKLAQFLAAHPEIERVEIQGHTDDVGSQAWNMDLSWRRAKNVRKYLLRQGVAPERLVVTGFGKTRPLERGSKASARTRNRRVEFRILRYREPKKRE